MTRPFNTGSPMRLALSAGVAAGALTLAAGQARAQVHPNDACGAPVEGIVTCTADDTYADGVWYGGEMTTDVFIRLEDGVVIAPVDYRAGLHAVTQNAAITYDGAGASVSARNATAVSALVEGAGDISIRMGDVSAVSDGETGARGIATSNDEGTTVIEVDRVSTVGDYATAISAQSFIGDITVRAGLVETLGDYAEGVAVSTGGAIMIDVGSVTTNGELALGVVAEGGLGWISIMADTVDTTGFAADGVTAFGAGPIDIAVNQIRGEGDFIWGVHAANGAYDPDGNAYFDNTQIRVGSIDLVGDNNQGVHLDTLGSAFVSVGEVTLDGDNGAGIALTAEGGATVIVDSLRLSGENTVGVAMITRDGLANAVVGSVFSERGAGVVVESVNGNAQAAVDVADVGGDFTYGVAVSSQAGNASAAAGTVVTRGFNTQAMYLSSQFGSVQGSLGSATTYGDYSRGVFAVGRTVSVTATGGISTGGASSEGVLARSTSGEARVFAAGPVATLGDQAIGLSVDSSYGATLVQAAAPVTTQGLEAHGIFGLAQHGDTVIVAESVVTSGDGADGIRARTRFEELQAGDFPPPFPFDGDIEVQVRRVEVSGAGSIGVSARGLGDARLTVGDALAADSFAIDANMIGVSRIELLGTARSILGSAVSAQGESVDVTIGAGARVEGGVDGLVLAAGARCVLPNTGQGGWVNPCPNPGYDQGPMETPFPPQPFGPGGVADVANAGLIVGGSGHAVRLTDGTLSLRNTGRIVGSLSTAGGDDRFENAGVWEISRDSDFGGGADSLINTGVVRFTDSEVARSIVLRGLEQFENAGLIDLRNGAVGDRLTVSGAFAGLEGSTVALDVNLAESAADRIVIAGAATGTTYLTLDGDHSQATLGAPQGIVVAEVGAGSAADAFALAAGEGDRGFVGHSLSYDANARRYALESAASAAAYRQTGLLQALDSVWSSSTDLWRAQTARTRDLGDTGDADGGFWFALQAGESSRDWTTEAASGDAVALDYRQERQGGQFGYDRPISETLRLGVTGGYGQSTLEYRDAADAFDVSTFNLGGYAAATRGRAFASLLVKYDRHETDLTSSALTRPVELSGSSWGAEGEVGYRFGDAGLFFEPLGGLRWMRSSADDLVNGAQTLAYEDAEDVAARLGLRIGGSTPMSGGARLAFYGGAALLQSFGDDYALRLTSGESAWVEAERVDTWGEGRFGVSYRTASGLETFAEGQGDLGSDYDAVSATVGMRIRF